MEKLIYLTTNPNKVNEANEFFGKKYGFNIEIVNPDFEIIEIQAETCSKVAAFSAEYAANKLNKPVLKSDSGLYIDALGGLPGPYNHYFDKQIGIDKFLDLFKNEKNRKARLEHCFAFCEPGKKAIVFSGGGEDKENIYETAIRELKEETGIHIKKDELMKLDAQATIPVANITGEFTWGEDVFVVPEYSFAVNIGNRQIELSNEHETMQWCNYEEAMTKLKYDSNKTALWELNERLKNSL